MVIKKDRVSEFLWSCLVVVRSRSLKTEEKVEVASRRIEEMILSPARPVVGLGAGNYGPLIFLARGLQRQLSPASSLHPLNILNTERPAQITVTCTAPLHLHNYNYVILITLASTSILTPTMSSQTTLGAAADDRKARLANLRNLKRKQPTDEIVAPESTRSPSPPAAENNVSTMHLSGRNYDAEMKAPKLGFDAPPTLAFEKATLEEQASLLAEETKKKAEEDAKDDKGIDLFKLQPKKPNWDLKRDLEKKMEILNVRTDNAIANLVRERITAAQKAKQLKDGLSDTAADGDAAGVDGVTLVEGLRMREKEEQEEEKRERQEEEALAS